MYMDILVLYFVYARHFIGSDVIKSVHEESYQTCQNEHQHEHQHEHQREHQR